MFMPRAQSTLRLTRLCTSRHRSDRGARMKSRCVVIGFFVASSLLGCGGAEGGDDGGQLPPSPAGGRSSHGGASSAETGGFTQTTPNFRAGSSGGLNLGTPASSGGAASNLGVTSPQAGGLPTRDPDLPGVDFEDGSWIQLGSSTSSGSFSAGGSADAAGPVRSPNAESAGGAAGGDRGSPIPK